MRVSVIVVCSSILFAFGCDCSGPEDTPCGSDDECAASERCVDGTCAPAPDAGAGMDAGPRDGGSTPPPDGGAVPCTSDEACAGGVCLEGACCASADDVCGTSCCADEEACFAGACVVPGATCVTNTDCDDGEYCERALGEGAGADAGVPPDGGASTCTATTAGRCLALPPSCDDAPPGAACIRTDCEFHPPVGALDAVVKWRWGPDEAVVEPERVDVWSTPVVGRIHDTNCDGAIDALDPSAIIFVSNDTNSAACHGGDNCRDGILRALDGATGRELWSLANVEGSLGFSGVSLALGDLDDDGRMDIVSLTAEATLAAIRGDGTVLGVGTDVLPYTTLTGLGWGGGLALADMNGDGDPEVGWRGAVYTWADGAFTERFPPVTSARGGWAHGEVSTSTSFFVNLDDDDDLELLAGRTAIEPDGTVKWQRTDLADGFAAIGDFDDDDAPDVVLVAAGKVYILDPVSGATVLGPFTLEGSGQGGPPTVADFDGDGSPEIGVAQQNRYSMIEPDYVGGVLRTVWTAVNHDNSSSVTGSTVFDFEGDGIAEVIYNDECFMWVYDGPTGDVRFTAPTDSFTGTEASVVADVDGDGHAEMVMISTGASPINWHCDHHDGADAYPAWEPPSYGPSWRGISVFRDAANGWVGTRTLWTQHAYHVTNTCDDRDSACDPPMGYGAIPTRQRRNWELPWLNNFRQNVQDEGIFDAPDATVSLRALCVTPVELVAAVRNLGRALLPAGVDVGFYRREAGGDSLLGTATTTTPIFPGQVAEVTFDAAADVPTTATFVARIVVDPVAPTFRECDDTNNDSDEVTPRCLE